MVFQTCCKASPQNKNVGELNGQLKFKVTDLGPRLHKVPVTGQFFNWPERVVLSYQSMQVVFVVSFKSLKLRQKYIGRPKGGFLKVC